MGIEEKDLKIGNIYQFNYTSKYPTANPNIYNFICIYEGLDIPTNRPLFRILSRNNNCTWKNDIFVVNNEKEELKYLTWLSD